MKPENILEVRNLYVKFPITGGIMLRKKGEVKAVDDVSFEIKKGETLGLVGESGCGKSTIGKAIINVLNFATPDTEISGEILLRTEDKEINILKLNNREMKKYRGYIQVIFQDPFSSLNPRYTIGQIIGEPLSYHSKLNRQERKERIEYLLVRVGLQPEYMQRFPHEFSGGQRQRVGIARALATNPKLIIADEPVSALDVSIQAQVINLLQDLQAEFNLSLLFISHDLSVVEHISSNIAVMYLGSIVEQGRSEDIYHNPKHPYSKALLSAVPLPQIREEKKERIILKGDVPTPLNKPSGCGFRTRCSIARNECSVKKPEMTEAGTRHFVACPYYNSV